MAQVTLRGWSPQKLDALRRAKGWTWAQCAVRTETPRSTLMGYFYSTVTPSPAALARIADALDVKTMDLIDVPGDVQLSDLRGYAGLSVADLAVKVNLSPSYTGVVVRGEATIQDPRLWAQSLGTSEKQVLAAWANSRRHLAED